MIHFRTRKYQTHIDSSYFLKDGPEIGDLSPFLIGDCVSISWPCSEERRDAIEGLDPRVIGRNLYYVSGFGNEHHVFTSCVVVERRHDLARMGQVGDLNNFGLTITLEATDGFAEDMLLWLMLGERPAWAGEKEDA